MIKRFIYYGLVMIIIAVALFFGSGYLFSNGIGKSITINNFTVRPDNFTYLPISYTNSSEVAIYVITNKPINVYLLNGTVYSAWRSHMVATRNASGISYLQQFHLNSSQVFKNSSFAIIPLIVNTSRNLSSNVVYVVMDNTFGSRSFNSSVNATLSYFPLHTSKLLSYELTDVFALLVLLSGIIVIIWGLVKTRGPKVGDNTEKDLPKDEKEKTYVDQLYKGVKKGKKKKSSSTDSQQQS